MSICLFSCILVVSWKQQQPKNGKKFCLVQWTNEILINIEINEQNRGPTSAKYIRQRIRASSASRAAAAAVGVFPCAVCAHMWFCCGFPFFYFLFFPLQIARTFISMRRPAAFSFGGGRSCAEWQKHIAAVAGRSSPHSSPSSNEPGVFCSSSIPSVSYKSQNESRIKEIQCF